MTLEQPIVLAVVELRPELRLDLACYHLPAARRNGNGPAFPDLGRSFPPSSWPSACGAVDAGMVYVRGGSLARLPACSACAAEPGAVVEDEATGSAGLLCLWCFDMGGDDDGAGRCPACGKEAG